MATWPNSDSLKLGIAVAGDQRRLKSVNERELNVTDTVRAMGQIPRPTECIFSNFKSPFNQFKLCVYPGPINRSVKLLTN